MSAAARWRMSAKEGRRLGRVNQLHSRYVESGSSLISDRVSDQDTDNSPENSGGEDSLSVAPPIAMSVMATSEEAGPSQHQQAGPSQLPVINNEFDLFRQMLLGNESDNGSD